MQATVFREQTLLALLIMAAVVVLGVEEEAPGAVELRARGNN